MSLTYVTGDPLLTRAQVLAFGHNARARTELGMLETQLLTHYAAAFAGYRKQCNNKRLVAGNYWIWREARPHLAFFVVRESSVSATRLRYVQSAAMKLARDYRLEGIKSLAIAPLGSPLEWSEIKPILETWFARSALPVIIYDAYTANVQADEGLPTAL